MSKARIAPLFYFFIEEVAQQHFTPERPGGKRIDLAALAFRKHDLGSPDNHAIVKPGAKESACREIRRLLNHSQLTRRS